MKTIRAKILSSIILITTVSLLITGGAASVMNYQSTVSTLQQTLQEAVVIAANQVSAEMKAQMNLVKEFAYNSVLWGDIDRDSKIDQLHSLRDNSGFDLIIMTDKGKHVRPGGFPACKNNRQSFYQRPGPVRRI